MTEELLIIKTENPESLKPCKIISRPAGDCPFYLVKLPENRVTEGGLEADIVEDTSAFFAGYDLTEEEEDLEAI